MVLNAIGKQKRAVDASASTFLGKTAVLVGFGDLADFAAATGLHLYKDVLEACEVPRARLTITDDPVWLAMAALVNDRLAKLLAAKEEIERKLRVDARRRLAERQRIENR